MIFKLKKKDFYMNIQNINSTSPNFTALKLTPASHRYLNTLETEELKFLHRVGKEMAAYKYWDLEIVGYGPVIRNRKSNMQVVDDFREGQKFATYGRLFDGNVNKAEIMKTIESKKTPLTKAVEITKQLERQSKYGPTGKENRPIPQTKPELIKSLMNEYFAW